MSEQSPRIACYNVDLREQPRRASGDPKPGMMFELNVSAFYQMVAKGFVTLAAVILDRLTRAGDQYTADCQAHPFLDCRSSSCK